MWRSAAPMRIQPIITQPETPSNIYKPCFCYVIDSDGTATTAESHSQGAITAA